MHDVYRRVLAWTFRHGWLTISLGAASVVVSLLIATQLKFRMVPFADRDQFAVEIYLRPDTSLERTGAVADSVYRALRADDRVKSVTSFVGCSSPRFQMSYAPQIAGKNYAQFIVNTTSVGDTEAILDEYADAWAERFPEADAIAGVATGAIPQGALVADLLNLPFVYVRSKPKDHGLENLIEGELRPGMKVVVVEDLISTGGSSLKAVEAIRNNGCEVSGMVAAYTYGFDVAAQAFKAANVKLITLTNYEAVVAEAVRIGYIDPSDVEVLNEWRKDPAHWNG